MSIRQGVLKNFNTAEYTATVQLAASYKVYLEDIPVSRNLSANEMINGRKVAVVFFEEHNVKEAVIIGVYV
jgi:hypothetical protein